MQNEAFEMLLLQSNLIGVFVKKGIETELAAILASEAAHLFFTSNIIKDVYSQIYADSLI